MHHGPCPAATVQIVFWCPDVVVICGRPVLAEYRLRAGTPAFLSDDYIDNMLVYYNQAVRITHAILVRVVIFLFRLPGARLFFDVGTQLLICYIYNVIEQLIL